MITVKNLSSLLVDFGAAAAPFDHVALREDRVPARPGYTFSDETYGSESYVYIDVPTVEDRSRLEKFLEGKGVKVDPTYCPGARVVEARVRWFKGTRWND